MSETDRNNQYFLTRRSFQTSRHPFVAEHLAELERWEAEEIWIDTVVQRVLAIVSPSLIPNPMISIEPDA